MADAKITLVYFNIKGRGEATRLLLSAAGKEFEDRRVTGESWEAYKPNAPLGQLPVLELNGERFNQSHAFNRYLADELGLGGKNRMDSLKADQVVNLYEDILRSCVKAFFEKDQAKKEEVIKSVQEGIRVKAQDFLEAMLKKNGTGYLVGDSLTYADIYAFDMHTGSPGDIIGLPGDKYPLLKALIEKVKSNPGIKAYLASQK